MSARNDHEIWADYAQRGAKAAQNRGEAMALAKMLRTEPAYSDPKHPNHAIVKRDLKALYDGHVPNESAGDVLHINGKAISGLTDPQLGRATTTPPANLVQRWNARASLQSFSPAERVALRQMMLKQPAYSDAKHPDHAAMVADAKALYEMDAPKGDA